MRPPSPTGRRRRRAGATLAALVVAAGGGGDTGAPAAGREPAPAAGGVLAPADRVWIDGAPVEADRLAVTRTGDLDYHVLIETGSTVLDFDLRLAAVAVPSGGGPPDPAYAVGRYLEGSEYARTITWNRLVVGGAVVLSTPACYPPDTHMWGTLSRLDARMDGEFGLYGLTSEDRAAGCGARRPTFALSAPVR